MKTTLEMARQFLRVRGEWQQRSAQTVDSAVSRQRLIEAESEMRALAWALDVDLNIMNAPKVGPIPFERAQVVKVQRIDEYGCWLVEIPANDDPGFRTEYCGFLLADKHVIDLERALSAALLTRRPALSGRLATVSPIRSGCIEGEAEWATGEDGVGDGGGGDPPAGA